MATEVITPAAHPVLPCSIICALVLRAAKSVGAFTRFYQLTRHACITKWESCTYAVVGTQAQQVDQGMQQGVTRSGTGHEAEHD
eukprot:1161488-Pelagomonas_calceolata.AAC.7